MAVYKSKGIVLRSIRYGEADRILDLYTQDAGLVSAIAKGIRRTRSRFGARLEPLSCVDFLAYSGRSLDTVTQVEVLRSFHGVREDLSRLKAAGGLVETVRSFSGGDEADRRVFNLLYRGLDALEGRSSHFVSIELAFALKLSILAGYSPQLDGCMGCGAPPEQGNDISYFAPDLGGILCADCRVSSREAFPLAPGAPEALRALIQVPVREATVDDRVEESVRRVVRSHVVSHAPGSAFSGGTGTRRPA